MSDLRAAVAALTPGERRGLLAALAEQFRKPDVTDGIRAVWHGLALEVADVDDLARVVDQGFVEDPDSWPWSS